MSSPAPFVTSPDFRQKVEKIGLQRGRLKTLGQLMGLQFLQRHQRMAQANQEAEARYVRRKAWGDDSAAESESDAMGHTILGDVTNPTPMVIHTAPPSGSGVGRLLAGLALGALVPGAGLAGYLLPSLLTPSQPAPAVTQPADDETIDLGLRHLDARSLEDDR